MKQKSTPPVAIIVTLPAKYFEDHNHAKYLQELSENDKNHIWYRVCKNVPVYDFLYVYTVVDNKVNHRANFIGIEHNVDYRFTKKDGGTKVFIAAKAIVTCGPVIMAPHEIPMRGFQGFRYITKILF